jgi:UDP-N-acetylmuramoylalanine--D-glutamate ligase
MTLETLALQGRPRVSSSLAASLSSKIFEIRKERIKESFSDFRDAEHRLEPVGNVHGIEFINDSKACTVNSTWFALESMVKPVIWIMGGLDRNNDFTGLRGLIENKVKAIVFLGKENTNLIGALQGLDIPTVVGRNMKEVVDLGYTLGRSGDVILLSPACPSFDQFENYEDRGRKFKEIVKNL